MPFDYAQGIFSANHSRKNGDDRGRTDNLRLAKPALSQLSYVPELKSY